MNRRRKTSMGDVAKGAGVSYATVERVLNGRGGVAREKESRVLEWARKLKIDRSLDEVSARWLRIAILMQKPTSPYYASLKQGFELAQKSFEAYRVMCQLTFFHDLEPQTIAATLNRTSQKAAGVIIVAHEHALVVEAASKVPQQMPVLTLASTLPPTRRLAYSALN